MQSVKRPLSPHLGHYKLPMLALLSITHRATGVAPVRWRAHISLLADGASPEAQRFTRRRTAF